MFGECRAMLQRHVGELVFVLSGTTLLGRPDCILCGRRTLLDLRLRIEIFRRDLLQAIPVLPIAKLSLDPIQTTPQSTKR